MRRDDDRALAFGEYPVEAFTSLRPDHPPNLFRLEGEHQHEVREQLEIVAKGVLGRSPAQWVVRRQPKNLREVFVRDLTTARHQEEGATSRQRRERIPHPWRQRSHHPVPQPEQAREDHFRGAVPRGPPPAAKTGAALPSSVVPAIKASVRSCATESVYCTGGDFIKYDDGASRAPAIFRSRPSLQQRIASITTPAELGENQTSSFSSTFSGTSPKERPSSRMYAHFRSPSQGT